MLAATPYETMRTDLLRFVVPGTRSLLDIGCSVGLFGSAIRAHRPGVRVVGIEPDAEAAAQARDRMDDVIEGFYPDVELDEKFDQVFLSDVIEHAVDPWDFLRSLPKHLSEGGQVVASIPNVRFAGVVWNLAVRGRFDYAAQGILDRTHLRFFTRATIIDLFQACGFEVDVIEPLDITYYPRWSERRILVTICERFGWHLLGDLAVKQFVVVASPASSAGRAD